MFLLFRLVLVLQCLLIWRWRTRWKMSLLILLSIFILGLSCFFVDLHLIGRNISFALVRFLEQLPLTVNLLKFLIFFLLSSIYIVVDVFEFLPCENNRIFHHLNILNFIDEIFFNLWTSQFLLFFFNFVKLFQYFVIYLSRVSLIELPVFLSNRFYFLLKILELSLKLLEIITKSLHQLFMIIFWLWLKSRMCVSKFYILIIALVVLLHQNTLFLYTIQSDYHLLFA